ncbi:MAG: flap endonuclease-1 [Thermoproteota archaeon]
MGVALAPLIKRRKSVELEDLKGKKVAVDANNILHQFLFSIRTSDGRPLRDSKDNITSHLIGLLNRSSRLIQECQIHLVFVFDGKPPELKEGEMEKRRKRREEAKREWKQTLEKGDYATARSKALKSSRLTKSSLEDAKKLLKLLGIPLVQAPSEAEAQTAYMAQRGDVWATNSRDYDALLFGSHRVLRYLTISTKRRPEIINLNHLLSDQKLSLDQLVDIAILMGTDYNDGVRGVGPKTALTLIKEHSSIEGLPEKIKSEVTENYDRIRKIFLEPKTIFDYPLEYEILQEEKLYHFLCQHRGLSRERVETTVNRLKEFYSDQQ